VNFFKIGHPNVQFSCIRTISKIHALVYINGRVADDEYFVGH
jgi:hypothetical protein